MKNNCNAHQITSDGICLNCDQNVPITSKNIGSSGMFQWDGEWLAWAPIDQERRPQWEGFTEVLDSHDCIISVGLTPYFAITGAIEELNFCQESVDIALEELFQQ